MPHHGEAVVAQRAHDGQNVAGHGGARVGGVVGRRGGLGGSAITAQVRADHGVVARQQRGDAMPGRVRARVAMQQDDRRTGTPIADAEGGFSGVDVLQGEAVKHVLASRTCVRP